MNQSFLPILICLLRGVNKVLEADINQSTEKAGVTITELNFLWTIFHEKEASVSRLAELTLLDASTVTQVLKRLKKKQLVEGFKNNKDHRFSYVKLTSKGDEARKLSMENSSYKLLDFLSSRMKNSKGKKETEIVINYLKEINNYFHGQDYVNWVFNLDFNSDKEITNTKMID